MRIEVDPAVPGSLYWYYPGHLDTVRWLQFMRYSRNLRYSSMEYLRLARIYPHSHGLTQNELGYNYTVRGCDYYTVAAADARRFVTEGDAVQCAVGIAIRIIRTWNTRGNAGGCLYWQPWDGRVDDRLEKFHAN